MNQSDKPNDTKARSKRPAQRKRPASQRKDSRNRDKHGWFYNHPIGLLCAIMALLGIAGFWMTFGFSGYHGETRGIYIPQGATYASIRDSLTSNLGLLAGNRTYILWRMQKGSVDRARGYYEVTPGIRALELSRRLRSGRQTPVSFTFNNARTIDDVARRVTAHLELSPEQFVAACDSILPGCGYKPEEFPAAFFPDTYQTYITASGADLVGIMLRYRDNFWTDERVARAESLGLTPVQAATLASIVEEESAKRDERPTIARLYLNRLHRGMRLQADPTVKFATGNFSLRRILGQHLSTQSAYNTYLHDGLPPGPIRVASRRTIEDMLQSTPHDYLYMCAKEDFSGYHNFATTYSEHLDNARRYRKALDQRGIK